MLYACAQSSLLFVGVHSVKEYQYLDCHVWIWHQNRCQMKVMLIDGTVSCHIWTNYRQTAWQKAGCTMKHLFNVRVCVEFIIRRYLSSGAQMKSRSIQFSLLSWGSLSILYFPISQDNHLPQKTQWRRRGGGCWQRHGSRREDKKEE